MSTPTAQVRVSLDSAQAEENANGLRESLMGALIPTIDLATVAGKAWDVFGAAVGAAYGYISDGVAEAANAIRAESKLEAALRSRGLATEGVADRLNNYNAVLMQSTGLADDELLALQTKLVAMGANADQLEVVTKATIGLSEVTGGDLASSAVTITKVLNGNAEALTKVGIFTNSTSEAMGILAARADMAGTNVEGAAGQWALLTSNLGELQEAIGDPIARSKGVIGGLTAMNEIVLGITVSVQAFTGAVEDVMGENGLGAIAGAGFLAAMTLLGPTGQVAGNTIIGLAGIADGFRDIGREAKAAAEEAAKANFVDGPITIDPIKIDLAKIAREDARAAAEAKRRAAEMETTRGKVDAFGSGLFNLEAELTMEATLRSTMIEQDEAREQAHANAILRGRESLAESMLAIDRKRADEEYAIAEKAHRSKLAVDQKTAAEKKAFVTSMIEGGTQMGAGLAAGLGAAAGAGEDAGEVLKRFAGQSIMMLGGTLIQLGAAAVAAGALGSVVPIFAAWTGGPAGVAAGLAAIAVGAGMVSAGAALGASGAPGGASARAAGGGASRGGGGGAPRTEADFGFGGGRGRSDEPINNVFQVNFHGGIYGGDPRRLGRELASLIDGSNSLIPRRRGG